MSSSDDENYTIDADAAVDDDDDEMDEMPSETFEDRKNKFQDESDEEQEGTSDESQVKVQVKFTTKLDKYRITETPFYVPIELTRYGLSEVINHLLALGKLMKQLIP